MTIIERLLLYLFEGFNTTGNEAKEREKLFIRELEEKGFHYNNDSEWWQRVWIAKTKDGKDTCLEVRKRDEKGWKYIMYGDNDEIFYEYIVEDKPKTD